KVLAVQSEFLTDHRSGLLRQADPIIVEIANFVDGEKGEEVETQCYRRWQDRGAKQRKCQPGNGIIVADQAVEKVVLRRALDFRCVRKRDHRYEPGLLIYRLGPTDVEAVGTCLAQV